VPANAADWRSREVAARRPLIDEAAVTAGREPSEIVTVYNLGGEVTDRPLAATRDEDGRWLGGSVEQWIDELGSAVVDYGAAGLLYLPFGQPGSAIQRWVHEIVPTVHKAIA